jgi:hypothetical protein
MTERPQTPAEHPTCPGTSPPRREPAEPPEGDSRSTVVDLFVERLGDRIDDRVAALFDELYAERMAESGPCRRAPTRERRAGFTLMFTSLVLGTLATIFTAGGVTAILIPWAGLVILNLAYLSRPR